MIFGLNFRKFRKISILVKFSTNFDFCQIFEKFRVCSKFSKNFWKISKNIDLGQIFEKFRFGQNFRKICVSSKIPNNFDLGQSKNFDFGQIIGKFRVCSKFSKNFWKISKNIDLGQIFEKFRFGQNFRKICVSSKIPNNFDLGQSKNFDFGQIIGKF